MTDTDLVIAALLDAHKPMLYHYGPARCIVCTRVAVETCERHGISAQAMPVSVYVPSPLDGGVEQLGFRPDGGLTGRWNGHLVALIDHRLVLDLTIDQINMPELGLSTRPHVFEVEPAFASGTPTVVDLDGTPLVYEARPADQTHRSTEDWTDDPERDRLLPIVEKKIARRRAA